MTYDSPKTIRRRQQRQTDVVHARRLSKSEFRPITTDEQWATACDFHLHRIQTCAGADAAGRHARALVTMAVYRRAYQVMAELNLRSVWKAIDIARHELLNVEVA